MYTVEVVMGGGGVEVSVAVTGQIVVYRAIVSVVT